MDVYQMHIKLCEELQSMVNYQRLYAQKELDENAIGSDEWHVARGKLLAINDTHETIELFIAAFKKKL